jgi:hypothetical protein
VYFGSAMARIEPRKGAAAIGLAMAISSRCGILLPRKCRETGRHHELFNPAHCAGRCGFATRPPRSVPVILLRPARMSERRNKRICLFAIRRSYARAVSVRGPILWYLHRGIDAAQAIASVRREMFPRTAISRGWPLYKFMAARNRATFRSRAGCKISRTYFLPSLFH